MRGGNALAFGIVIHVTHKRFPHSVSLVTNTNTLACLKGLSSVTSREARRLVYKLASSLTPLRFSLVFSSIYTLVVSSSWSLVFAVTSLAISKMEFCSDSLEQTRFVVRVQNSTVFGSDHLKSAAERIELGRRLIHCFFQSRR